MTQAISAVAADAAARQDVARVERRALQQQSAEIARLARRDAEVRAHEQAHASVGGIYAGSPSYEFQRGPNGVSYAVSGHVDIDVAPVPGDPQATLEKMQVVQRAALAVAQPSAADRAVAAQAAAQASEARAQLAAARREDRPAAEQPGAARAAADNFPTDVRGGYVDLTV